MPRLFELIQQEIGYNGCGKDVVPDSWMQAKRGKYYPDPSLKRLYETIMAWPSLPLLFNRGAGELKTKRKVTKSKTKPRKKRRKFGDEEDSDDEAWVPKGASKRGKWVRNPETGRYTYVPLFTRLEKRVPAQHSRGPCWTSLDEFAHSATTRNEE